MKNYFKESKRTNFHSLHNSFNRSFSYETWIVIQHELPVKWFQILALTWRLSNASRQVFLSIKSFYANDYAHFYPHAKKFFMPPNKSNLILSIFHLFSPTSLLNSSSFIPRSSLATPDNIESRVYSIWSIFRSNSFNFSSCCKDLSRQNTITFLC